MVCKIKIRNDKKRDENSFYLFVQLKLCFLLVWNASYCCSCCCWPCWCFVSMDGQLLYVSASVCVHVCVCVPVDVTKKYTTNVQTTWKNEKMNWRRVRWSPRHEQHFEAGWETIHAACAKKKKGRRKFQQRAAEGAAAAVGLTRNVTITKNKL